MNILRVRVRHRTWVGCVCARACTLTCGSYHLSVNAVAVECHFIVHHLPSFLLPAARRVGFVCNNALGHPIHRPPDAPSCTVCVCVCSYSVVHFGSLHSHEFVCVYVCVRACARVCVFVHLRSSTLTLCTAMSSSRMASARSKAPCFRNDSLPERRKSTTVRRMH